MKNWVTTLFGILAAAGEAVGHFTTGTISTIGHIVAAAALAGLGKSAADAISSNTQAISNSAKP
jgi:hypothetical protein